MGREYSIGEYRDAVSEMERHEFGSEEFKFASMKFRSIMEANLRAGGESGKFMMNEVEGALSNMNDSAIPYSDADVQYLLWLLDETGYGDLANEIRGWDWL